MSVSQPPAKLDDRAEWRLLTSKTVGNIMNDDVVVGNSGTSDEQACGPGLGCDDTCTLNKAPSKSSVVLVEHPKDDLSSVFLTSLSAFSSGTNGDKRTPSKERKVLL